MSEFTAALDHARNAERQATRARTVLDAVVKAEAELPGLRSRIATAEAELGVLTDQREALDRDVADLSFQRHAAQGLLADVQAEIASTRARGEAGHETRTAELDAKYEAKNAEAERLHAELVASLKAQADSEARQAAEAWKALTAETARLTVERDAVRDELKALKARFE